MEGKKTRGRQKIAMKKIDNEDDRYASFTKRRVGIYKRASELCTLCNIDIGVIIFSPTRKLFTFFHPNMNSIIDRVFNLNSQSTESTRLAEARTRAKIDQLSQKLDQLSVQAEVEIEREKILDQMNEATDEKGWWEKPIEEYNKEEVGKMMEIFNNLHIQIVRRKGELNNGGSSSSSLPEENLSMLPDGTTTVPNRPYGTMEANVPGYGPGNVGFCSSSLPSRNAFNTFYAYPGHEEINPSANISSSSSLFLPPSDNEMVHQGIYVHSSYGHGYFGSSSLSHPQMSQPNDLYTYPGGRNQIAYNSSSSSSSFPQPNAPYLSYEHGNVNQYGQGNVGLFSPAALPPTNASNTPYAYPAAASSSSWCLPTDDQPNTPYFPFGPRE